MAERIQIIVEAKDATSGVLRGISSQFGALGMLIEDLTSPTQNWGNLAATATSIVINGMKDAIDTTLKYAGEVRELSLVSGQGAEETSRFVQVLDDYGITADDALAATRALTKNGLTPSISTLAELSDRYLALNSNEEKNKFILDNLGRSGLQWVEVLNKGSAAIKAQGANVEQSLILSQKQLDSTRQFELAVDDLQDKWQGLKVQLGTEVIPVLADTLKWVNDNWEELQKWGNVLLWIAAPTVKFSALLRELVHGNEDVAVATGDYADAAERSVSSINSQTTAMDSAAQVAQELTQHYQTMIGQMQGMQSETKRWEKSQRDKVAADEEADKELRAGTITVDEYNAKIAENEKTLDASRDAHKEWAAGVVFSLLQARAAADGQITDGEMKVLEDAGVGLGIFGQDTVAAIHTANKAFDNLDASNALDTIDAVQSALLALTGQDYVITLMTDTSGVMLPGYGSGAAPAGGQAGTRTGGHPYASGGTVYAGTPAWVGEHGAEPFFPQVNGRILSHEDAMAAMRGGTTIIINGRVRTDNDLNWIAQEVSRRQG